MKAAIFDLDGTILNSMGMWRRLEQNFLTGLGIEPSDWIFRRMDTLGLHGSAGWLIGEFHLDKKEPGALGLLRPSGARRISEDGLPQARGGTGAPGLRAHGIGTSLATLTAHKLVDPVLEAKGISPLLDHILTVEDVGGVKKDRPDLF